MKTQEVNDDVVVGVSLVREHLGGDPSPAKIWEVLAEVFPELVEHEDLGARMEFQFRRLQANAHTIQKELSGSWARGW